MDKCPGGAETPSDLLNVVSVIDGLDKVSGRKGRTEPGSSLQCPMHQQLECPLSQRYFAGKVGYGPA